MTATVVSAALDLAALERWLRSSDVEVAGPLSAQLITGGRSNLTFFLEDATGRRWVVRRPPLGSVLATAHDVRREFRVMSALADTPVPVPRVLGVDVDSDQTDFYVMDVVPGLVLRDAATTSTALGPAARARAGVALAETLAALHAVDPDAMGLGRLGRGEDYLARQIAMWQRQAEQHRVTQFAEADAVRDRLLAALPPQREISLVHGDYRLDNAILDDNGDVRAVLDWELCTRGDPLADLGVFLCYWTEALDAVMPFPDPPTALSGFPDRRGILQIYERASGRSIERIDYYVAFGAWRLALVFEGVAARSAAGAYGAPDAVEEQRLADVARGMVQRAGVLLDGAGA
jgi:aminoglycoside phosphotransferase (APT) family kinase protein